MKTYYVDPVELDIKDYIKRPAIDNDYSNIISCDAKIIDNKTKQVLAYYIQIPKEETEQIRQVVRRVEHFIKSKRSQGLTTVAKIFGYQPRDTIRKDYCSSSALAREQPKYHAIVANFGRNLAKYYKQHAPEIYEEHLKIAEDKVLPEWRILGSPFTSGIINKDTQLNYHHDAGNFKNVYSNMIAFRDKCKGGHLCFPKYDCALEIEDSSLTFFDGQKIMHGVTPFEMTSQGGYRITVVYYTLQQMWKCLEVTKEVARIQEVKTKRENNRLKRLKGELIDDNLTQRELKKSPNYKRFIELGIDLKWIIVPFTRLPLEVQKKLVDYKR